MKHKTQTKKKYKTLLHGVRKVLHIRSPGSSRAQV